MNATMKRNILCLGLCAAMAICASATVNPAELRVYINPGHGSWSPNDRPAGLVGHNSPSRFNTDTLAFFETNTDLQKAFGAMQHLIDLGLTFDATLNQTGAVTTAGAARDMSNNIVLSRVKNGPYAADNGAPSQLAADGKTPADDFTAFNRNFSEICAEVDANNFDIFLSIHSNALTEGAPTNYPLMLYYGYNSPKNLTFGTQTIDNVQFQNLGRRFADLAWPYAYANPHMVWTNFADGSKCLRGDADFYATTTSKINGLGVLKHLTPGFLAEGYFHTYQPARHRAMNWDADRIEGTAYARGLADLFGLQKATTGEIYGTVHDLEEHFTDKFYTPNENSIDVYKPLNGVTVTLKKDGQPIATYTTDNYYNGAFVFSGLQPGDYQVECTLGGFQQQIPCNVTVAADQTSYPQIQLKQLGYEPPAAPTGGPNPYASQLRQTAGDEVSFTLNADAEDVVIRLTCNGNEAKTMHLGACKAGNVTTQINMEGLADGTYDWEVTTVKTPNTGAIRFADDNALLSILNARGIDCDVNPTSPGFGRLYVASCAADAKGGTRTGSGLFVLGADLTDALSQGNTAYAGAQSWSATDAPNDVSVCADGRVLVTDWGTAHSGVWIADPTDLTAAFTPVFDQSGTRSADGVLTVTVNAVNGPVASAVMAGDIMYTADKALTPKCIFGYDLVNGTLPWSLIPLLSLGNHDGKLANANQRVARDGRGGIWVSQYRWNEDAYPVAVHFNGEGTVDYTSLADGKGLNFAGSGPFGAMGTNADGSLIAVANGVSEQKIYVSQVTFSTAGVPSLHKLYTIDGLQNRPAGVAFDYADNLYVSFNGKGIACWGLPNSGQVTTPGATPLNLTSGITDVSADSQSAEAEYFDLTGRRVANPAQGVYIKKAGSHAEKVILGANR